jgi:hypothetical protein
MFTKRWKALTVGLLAAALFSPLGVAGANPNMAGASSPEEAVRILIETLYNPSAGNKPCNALNGQFADCPVTARLLQRLQNPIAGQETGNLVSRSQNPPQSVTITPVDNTGQLAHIDTKWQYGTSSYSITFAVVKEADGWRVDDSYCTGAPQTSIYNPPTGPCQVVDNTVPGIPRTGNGDLGYVEFAILGGLLVLSGVVMVVARREVEQATETQ